MKKHLLFSLLLLSVGLLAGQTWIRYYPWADVCTSTYTSATANVYNVIPALGGGYLLQGHAEFIYVSGEYEVPVMLTNIFWKIDENGDVVWRRIYNNLSPYNIIVSNGIDRYYCIDSSQGTSFMDIFDSELNHLAHYSFWDQNGFDAQLNDAVFVNDGLVFAGMIRNPANTCEYVPTVVKTNLQLGISWQSLCRIGASFYPSFSSISVTNNNDFTAISHWDTMFKCSSVGDSLWTIRVNSNESWFVGETSHSNGNSYIVTGNSQSPNYIVIIVSPDGDYINEFDTNISLSTNFGGIEECIDGGVIIFTAGPDDNPTLTKLTNQGEIVWSRTYSAVSYPGLGSNNFLSSISGYFLLCGSGAQSRFVLICANHEGVVTNQDLLMTPLHAKISHFPNPVTKRVTIRFETTHAKGNLEIEIYNIRGQKLFSVPINDFDGSCEIDLDSSLIQSQQSGVYLYVLLSGSDKLAAGRMVIIK